MKQQQALTDFSRGELSRFFLGLFNLPVYGQGVAEMTDVFPIMPGGFTLRPGFRRAGDCKNTGRVMLFPFIISDTLAYDIELGPAYMRFWKNNALLLSMGTPIEVATPYDAADLPLLQIVQDANMLIIAAGSGLRPLECLTLTGPDAFSFGALVITGNAGLLPFQSAGNYPRAVALHDGRLWAFSSLNDPQDFWASEPFDYGNFTFFDTISSTSKQLRDPALNFDGTRTNGSTTVSGIAADKIADFKIGDRITGPGIQGKDKETFSGATTVGSPIITNVSSSVISRLAAGEALGGTSIPNTTILSLGANSVTLNANATATNGAGTFERPEIRTYVQTIGASSIVMTLPATASGVATLVKGWPDPTEPDYQDVTTTRDIITNMSAIHQTIASDQNDEILWGASGRDLIIGTRSGERVIPSGSTALNIEARRQTAHGSAKIQPFMLNNAVIFVTGDRKGVREYFYSNDEAAYTSPELTYTASEILGGKVREIDYQNNPLPIAWFLLETGVLIGCVYSRTYGFAAWFRVQTSGTIESMSVISTSGDDQLRIAVNRGGVRSLEYMVPLFSVNDHLDGSALAVKASGKITGISWITGAARVVYAGVAYDVTIAAGETNLPAAIPDGATVLVGIPFTGTVEFMPIQAQNRRGTDQGRAKTVIGGIVRVLDSFPFKMGPDTSHLDLAEFTDTPAPASRDVRLPIPGTFTTEARVVLVQDSSLDLTVLAAILEVDAGGSN